MIWGGLSDRFGARPMVMVGAALFSASLWLAGQAPTLPAFHLTYGVLAGGPAMGGWIFDRTGAYG